MREASNLLEREEQLAALDAAVARAAAGRGGVVLVSGEAGAGKTALVRHFAASLPTEHRLLWGMCDDLLVPRPLGPFRDMGAQAPALGTAISTLDQGGVADALMEELGLKPSPAVAVIEDAQWADAATIDLIGFIGRRIDRVSAMLIVTYRDTGTAPDHPLRQAFGKMAPAHVTRIAVGRLSKHAVAELAGTEDIADLYRLSRGNPFYVNELLGSSDGVPATVHEAVMARLGRLGPAARECVEVAAVVPNGAEDWLLHDCGVSEGLEESQLSGLLQRSGHLLEFSHELTRRAVEDHLSEKRRRNCHALVLEALARREEDPARLAHHAFQAGDSRAVARYSPVAARRAVALHGHREALEHYRQALSWPDHFSPEERAALLEEFAAEGLLASALGEAASALEQAIVLRENGDPERLGADLTLLSEVRWAEARGTEAEKAALRAVEVLEERQPGPALAAAYAALSKLAMVDARNDDAFNWGGRAIELARSCRDARALAQALNTVGSARLRLDPRDDAMLVESLLLSQREGLHDGTLARAYVNLAVCHLEGLQYPEAQHYLDEGLDYCDRHDVYIFTRYLRSIRSWWHMEQGNWNRAESDLEEMIDEDSVVAIRALRVKGLIQARRGDPRAESTLRAAYSLAERLDESQGLIPISAALAELAWLSGDPESARRAVEDTFRQALLTGVPRWIGETGTWLARTGVKLDPPPSLPAPYLLQMEGRWADAAAAWAGLGREYEEADALAETDDADSLLRALAILDRLEARPRAATVRKRLTTLGVSRIPRGPTTATRENPAGLTPRQSQVLALLAEDLTYRQIANRLYVSPKTVDHHVTAIRTKLGVATRDQAVDAGRRLGLLSP